MQSAWEIGSSVRPGGDCVFAYAGRVPLDLQLRGCSQPPNPQKGPDYGRPYKHWRTSTGGWDRDLGPGFLWPDDEVLMGDRL